MRGSEQLRITAGGRTQENLSRTLRGTAEHDVVLSVTIEITDRERRTAAVEAYRHQRLGIDFLLETF